jgi:hypothetical protein
MTRWRLVTEPTLDDLLEDEIMAAVLRSAGIDAGALRASLAALALRLRDARQLRLVATREPCGGAVYC